MNIICHKSEWLRHWWRLDLFDEIVSKLVLQSWLLVENCFRFDVEDSVVTLVNHVRVDDAAVRKVFVDHVLLAELQMQVFGPLVVLVKNPCVDVEWVVKAIDI